MKDITWIKIQLNIFDNPKIKQIKAMPNGNMYILLWFYLIVIAGKCEADGSLTCAGNPYTAQTLTIETGMNAELIKEAIDVFIKFGMIEESDGTMYLPGWGIYQNLEGMDKVREQNRIRQQKHRDKHKDDKKNNKEIDYDTIEKTVVANL